MREVRKVISVTVKEIALDQAMNPVVLLIDAEQSKVLPIWVGPFEARAIALSLQATPVPRPMTHDLMKNLCDQLGAEVAKVVVSNIYEGTYYAEIYLQRGGKEMVIDARPSDAIALALRTGANLYITEEVAAYALDLEEVADEEEKELLKKWLAGEQMQDDNQLLQ
ncbi:MAG: bifunctional nuclease family protein [Clostridia bacterium]|nr:MAG: bifunctional nuclease family protein [Clostridia bacterium]